MFALFNSMFVNSDTLMSLQILQDENHPNSHQNASGSGSKESLSLFGLFQHFVCTRQGKLKLRQIFLRPSIDTICFFLRSGNAELIPDIHKCLKKIKNMRASIALLRRGIDNPNRKVSVSNSVWAALQKFAAYSLQLRGLVRGMSGAERVPLIMKVSPTMSSSLALSDQCR
jgi:DNA mismatch repair protein MSH5